MKDIYIIKETKSTTEKLNSPELISEVQIPKEYKKFKELFYKTDKNYKLPEHSPFNYKIVLKEEAEPSYILIYRLSKG